MQWDLVCKRAYLKDLSQTILTVGVMFGAMGFTTLSDRIGRKPVFLFSQWAMVVVGVITAFVPNFYVFLVLRFFTGAFQQVRPTTGAAPLANETEATTGIVLIARWPLDKFAKVILLYTENVLIILISGVLNSHRGEARALQT